MTTSARESGKGMRSMTPSWKFSAGSFVSREAESWRTWLMPSGSASRANISAPSRRRWTRLRPNPQPASRMRVCGGDVSAKDLVEDVDVYLSELILQGERRGVAGGGAACIDDSALERGRGGGEGGAGGGGGKGCAAEGERRKGWAAGKARVERMRRGEASGGERS